MITFTLYITQEIQEVSALMDGDGDLSVISPVDDVIEDKSCRASEVSNN